MNEYLINIIIIVHLYSDVVEAIASLLELIIESMLQSSDPSLLLRIFLQVSRNDVHRRHPY